MENDFESCKQKEKCTNNVMADFFNRMDQIANGVRLAPKEWKTAPAMKSVASYVVALVNK